MSTYVCVYLWGQWMGTVFINVAVNQHWPIGVSLGCPSNQRQHSVHENAIRSCVFTLARRL
jgi:hypothetical protein